MFAALAPNEHKFTVEHRTAFCAREFHSTVPINYQFARRARTLEFWRGANHFRSKAAPPVAANGSRNRFPDGTMPGASRRQCVSNLVQDRITNFVLVVQLDEI